MLGYCKGFNESILLARRYHSCFSPEPKQQQVSQTISWMRHGQADHRWPSPATVAWWNSLVSANDDGQCWNELNRTSSSDWNAEWEGEEFWMGSIGTVEQRPVVTSRQLHGRNVYQRQCICRNDGGNMLLLGRSCRDKAVKRLRLFLELQIQVVDFIP